MLVVLQHRYSSKGIYGLRNFVEQTTLQTVATHHTGVSTCTASVIKVECVAARVLHINGTTADAETASTDMLLHS